MQKEILEYVEKFKEATGSITIQGVKCPPVAPDNVQIVKGTKKSRQAVSAAILSLKRQGLIKQSRTTLIELTGKEYITPTKGKIKEYLKKHPHAQPAEISKETGLNYHTVRNHLVGKNATKIIIK